MDKYLLFTLIALTVCLLLAVGLLARYCRRIEHRCNRNVAECLRTQDRMARELERTRAEKSALQELLRMKLSEVMELLLLHSRDEPGRTSTTL